MENGLNIARYNMTEYEKLHNCMIYDALDEEIGAEQKRSHRLCERYNSLGVDDDKQKQEILKELFIDDDFGDFRIMEKPMFIDNGKEITIGKDYDATTLDPANGNDDGSYNIIKYLSEGLVRNKGGVIVPGVAEKSFGIHVGAMAGLPGEVVDRAAQILKNLEANEIDVNATQKVVRRPRKKLSELPGQMTFFSTLQ